MQVTVLRPEGFALPAAVMDKARRAAAASGGSLTESSEPREALAGAEVVYVKEWACTARYGDEAYDAAARARLRHWCLNEDWFAPTRADCRLMHCLPVRRNVAIADSLLDGPRAAVLRQAYNRLPAQMAVLHQLLKPAE